MIKYVAVESGSTTTAATLVQHTNLISFVEFDDQFDLIPFLWRSEQAKNEISKTMNIVSKFYNP